MNGMNNLDKLTDICNDCFEDGWRIMFCKKCHQKIFYFEGATCEDCGDEADYIQCGNCGLSNKFKGGYEAMERFC